MAMSQKFKRGDIVVCTINDDYSVMPVVGVMYRVRSGKSWRGDGTDAYFDCVPVSGVWDETNSTPGDPVDDYICIHGTKDAYTFMSRDFDLVSRDSKITEEQKVEIRKEMLELAKSLGLEIPNG